ncbi:MAG: class I SAM-dependent DNA methyltransferase [Clostridia bacterium]|nr:class I SAM-dependent DNA methyltransferase [Clostridia bacterium]
MTDAQQRETARQFYYRWNGKGREDEDARSYWIEILTNILGVDRVTERVDFEKKVIGPDGNTKRIDVYIPETHVLIEQKSLGIALDKPQAGHDGMTPYEQAKMYDNGLPFDEKARWIVTSNFAEIWIYDMNQRKPEPVKIALADLQSKYHMLDFLVNQETKKISDEMKVSLQAGELVGKLYDVFFKQYKNPDDPETLKSLNKLCVRIVFCLYAEDASVFGRKNMFHDYMAQFDAPHARKGLRDLFRVLNQKPEERDAYLADDDPLLAAFPYVNGGLFADDDITIPPFTDEIINLLLRNASEDFDWSGISPTIFGAVFESTLNPETRRSGGMHYTSIENIHKVIDPLFLDDLKAELEEIKGIAVWKTQEHRLHKFQDKLAATVLLDPAAGSGNFLTESYICLRRLENEVISLLQHGQVIMGIVDNPIKVNISQLYGIEINDFAVTVARTALWIAENQMMKETEDIVHMTLDFLPLKTAAHIVEGNALQINWEEVVPKGELTCICGNPPFSGGMKMSDEKKKEMQSVIGADASSVGEMDYVAAWYYLGAKYIQGTNIKCCFVSTNSIVQGQQAITVWEPLFTKYNICIDYAYRTFKWTSEASDAAAVHCVIVCFSTSNTDAKTIYDEKGNAQSASNINSYLVDAENWFIHPVSAPIWDVPPIKFGSMPRGKAFIMPKEEYDEIIKDYPFIAPYLKEFYMGNEFINGGARYCMWLIGAEASTLRKCPPVMSRIEEIRQARLESKAAETRRMADTPTLFAQIAQPDDDYIAVPAVSTQRRRYIPIGFLSKDVIAGNKLYIIPGATVYHFGILTSNVHMAWMRLLAGRMKSDYSYSKDIVYNNFPWPEVSDDQKQQIEKTAQGILNARALYPDASLADLYDPLTMPPELKKAHQANDAAVMKAYGMPIKETDEAACVAWLMRLYQEKVSEKDNVSRR